MTAVAEVFSNADLLRQCLQRVHPRPTLRLRAASRTCHSWRNEIEQMMQTHCTVHSPRRLEKSIKLFKKHLKWPEAVAALPNGGTAVLGQSTNTTLVFIYDAALQPEAMLELTGALRVLDPSRVVGMVLARSTQLDGAGQAGTSLYLLMSRGCTYPYAHDSRNTVFEFDFNTGVYHSNFDWLEDDVGNAVDLQTADDRLYVGFEREVSVMDLTDTTNELAGLRLPAGMASYQSIALHGDELMLFSAIVLDPPSRRVSVFKRSALPVEPIQWQHVRDFGITGIRPGEFGEWARIRCVSGLLVVVECVRVSGKNSTCAYHGAYEDRLQVLALTGEPLCVLTEDSSLLPPRRLHMSKRFPIGRGWKPSWIICVGRGTNADRLFVCGDRHSGHVWSLRIVRSDSA